VYSFIKTSKLRGLSSIGRSFGLVHKVQSASTETGGTSCYSFNNQKGFMTAIEKKSNLKY